MKPTAAQFRKMFSEIYRAIPDDEPSKRERQLIMSCVLAAADATERCELALLKIAEAISATPTATAPVGTPDEETEDMPPIARSTVTASSPAAPSASVIVTSAPNAPAPNGASS